MAAERTRSITRIRRSILARNPVTKRSAEAASGGIADLDRLRYR